jgi:hypothetical protein
MPQTSELIAYRVLFRRNSTFTFAPPQFAVVFRAVDVLLAHLDAERYLDTLHGQFDIVDILEYSLATERAAGLAGLPR